MILQLGFMDGAEVATWFGIKYKTYTDHRKAYLQKLESFAKFTPVRGGVNIEEIYIEEYIKNFNPKGDDVLYLKAIQEAPDHLTSISGIVAKLVMEPEFKGISPRTLEGRISKAGVRTFGITGDPKSRGLCGSRDYIWAIKLYDRPNHYRRMTDEENEIYTQLISAYCLGEPEKISRAALLEDAFLHSESMTKEEYFELKTELGLDYFTEIMTQFKHKTGLQLARATLHEIDAEYKESTF